MEKISRREWMQLAIFTPLFAGAFIVFIYGLTFTLISLGG